MTTTAQELFNQWAREGRDIEMEDGHKHAVREALRDVALPPDATILDLGCGNGFVTRALAHRLPEATVIGVDISEEMIECARDLTPDALVNAVYFQGNYNDEAVQSERYDLIFAMESIYYMIPAAETMRALANLLKPGGQLVIVSDYYAENEVSHEWPRKYGVPMELLSAAEYMANMAEAGLEDVSQRSILYPAGEGVEAWKVEKGSLLTTAIRPSELTAEEILRESSHESAL